ncbi:MAG: RsmB/NOP family class I SAM-dependent RNA methyltransferase [Bacteroidota bacterium]
MRYIWQHINTILESYSGKVPLTHYLRHYFKQYPKLGSRDRKILSDMAYSWYRASRAISNTQLSIEEKIGCLLLLCTHQPKYLQDFLPAQWQIAPNAPVTERIALLQEYLRLNIDDIYGHSTSLSYGINREEWLSSMLSQPRLFIRVRKDMNKVLQLLEQHSLSYEMMSDTCIALPNGAAIDKILPEDVYVVQDASSQSTGAYFHPEPQQQWFDCCAGAGGKSLLLKDIEPTVKLSVSDKRKSILHNLETRFQQYHHAIPASYCVDAADKQQLYAHLHNSTFDAVICDVPCSGSGTWARTPEQLYFFDQHFLKDISQQQKAIATNVAHYIKKGGKLIYITCSVFKEENEDVVMEVMEKTGLQLESLQLINGIAQGADSMFVAVMQK